MSTFTTTKLTKKQAHALLRTMAQSLNESEARNDPDDVALSHAFGAPCASGAPREVLTRKLLGQCIRTGAYASGERAIGLRAAYRHEPASARWGAIHTSNRGTRVVPTLDDAWKALDKLAQRYGVALARVKQGTSAASGGGAPVELAAGVTAIVRCDKGDSGAQNPEQGTFTVRRDAARNLRHEGCATPEPFPHAPALARALSAHTRSHELRSEDGDSLHRDAVCALSLGLREPMMARTVRARSSLPCVQLYIDWSSSMGGNEDAQAAACANSIIEACTSARVPIQVLAFTGTVRLIRDWRERTWAPVHASGSTDLPAALGTCLPFIGARAERRKIALIITDGAVGYRADTEDTRPDARGVYPLTHQRRYADAHGIELYAIGLGVDVPHGPETFHGSIRIDKPEELCSTAARELARVIGRGERVAV